MQPKMKQNKKKNPILFFLQFKKIVGILAISQKKTQKLNLYFSYFQIFKLKFQLA